MSFKEYASKEYVDDLYLRKEHINTVIRDYIILKDRSTGYLYNVYVEDGVLTSSCKIKEIKVNTMPDKIVYMQGEKFDPTGMEIIVKYDNNEEIVIKDHPFDNYVTNSTINLSYINEVGEVYTTTIEVKVTDFDPSILIDFEYLANEDGTYTITGWKQTLNGEPSTELIIPDNDMVVL